MDICKLSRTGEYSTIQNFMSRHVKVHIHWWDANAIYVPEFILRATGWFVFSTPPYRRDKRSAKKRDKTEIRNCIEYMLGKAKKKKKIMSKIVVRRSQQSARVRVCVHQPTFLSLLIPTKINSSTITACGQQQRAKHDTNEGTNNINSIRVECVRVLIFLLHIFRLLLHLCDALKESIFCAKFQKESKQSLKRTEADRNQVQA